MTGIQSLPDTDRAKIINRLKRIEGQSRGLQAMIDENRDCVQILDQIASMKAAINGLSGQMLEVYALHCLRHPDQFASAEDAVAQAVQAVVRAGR